MTLSTEHILALAPDAASAKAGSQLAQWSKWSGLGRDGQALWGLCQGSGKEPYRAQIDLAEPAFKCTCPSRKFPCKHGLGLYLLYAQQADRFAAGAAPDWVLEWHQRRAGQAEKKAEKLAEKQAGKRAQEKARNESMAGPESGPESAELNEGSLPDKQTGQQKRQARRADNIEKGLDVLERWLDDLAQQGLAAAAGSVYRQSREMAIRMVDAQAAGLAERLRRIADIEQASDTGTRHARCAVELGRLALLIAAYRTIEQLPQALQMDVRSAIGLHFPQDDILALPAIEDDWVVCGHHTVHAEKLSRRVSYFRGRHSHRWATLWQHAAGMQTLPPPAQPGKSFHGEFHYYPGAYPLRVLAAEPLSISADTDGDTANWERISAAANWTQVGDTYADALAVQPWLDHLPVMFEQASFVRHNEGFMLRDVQGMAMPIEDSYQRGWHALALGGGAACRVFGTWNGEAFRPLGLEAGASPVSIDHEINA